MNTVFANISKTISPTSDSFPIDHVTYYVLCYNGLDFTLWLLILSILFVFQGLSRSCYYFVQPIMTYQQIDSIQSLNDKAATPYTIHENEEFTLFRQVVSSVSSKKLYMKKWTYGWHAQIVIEHTHTHLTCLIHYRAIATDARPIKLVSLHLLIVIIEPCGRKIVVQWQLDNILLCLNRYLCYVELKC